METAERLCDDLVLINRSKMVLAGSLRQVKESFNRNVIAMRITGGETVLQESGMIANIERHADEIEVLLAENADSQMLLKNLIDSGAVISKFELVEPSLNDIFIEKVQGSNA
jgi:ABC-2 type transport system ATP-binding protein